MPHELHVVCATIWGVTWTDVMWHVVYKYVCVHEACVVCKCDIYITYTHYTCSDDDIQHEWLCVLVL